MSGITTNKFKKSIEKMSKGIHQNKSIIKSAKRKQSNKEDLTAEEIKALINDGFRKSIPSPYKGKGPNALKSEIAEMKKQGITPNLQRKRRK